MRNRLRAVVPVWRPVPDEQPTATRRQTMGERWTVTDVRKAHERARRVLPQLGDLYHNGSYYEVHLAGAGTVHASGAREAADTLHRMTDAVIAAQHAAAVAVVLSELDHGAEWDYSVNILVAASDQDAERIAALLRRVLPGEEIHQGGRLVNVPYPARYAVRDELVAVTS